MRILLFSALFAASAQAAPDGYVVKVDSDAAYLDLGGLAPAVGARFSVLRPGEELKNPVTGLSLGPVLEKAGAGRISSVEEKYSVGRLDEGRAEAGWRARLLDAPAPAAPPPAPAAPPAAPPPAAPGGEALRAPALKSPLFPMEAVDLAVADVDGDGAPDVVLADADKVEVRRMSGDWGVLCAYADKKIGSRILSLEARDVDGDGRAEVFVSVHNRVASAVETIVLDCRGGKLVQRETLPWLVRSYGAADGGRPLAVQALEPDSNFPASDVYTLEWSGGRYQRSKEALKHKRLSWLYGFAFAPAAGDPILLHFNNADRLTLRYAKGSWTSPEAFGYGTGKLSWHGRDFEFHPRFFTRLEKGELSAVYAVRNVPKLMGMSAAFASYSHAELHRMAFNGMSLEPAWHAELSGYAAGLERVAASAGAPARLAVGVVGANGRTAVWLFDE